MKPLAVWYHCRLSGGHVPIDTMAAMGIMAEQMAALKNSGLLNEASEFYIGVNGDEEDAQLARLLCPCPKVKLLVNSPALESEIPTMTALQLWLAAHLDWYVLYHHIKGVTHPSEVFYTKWRVRMENACVMNWRRCVSDLDSGFDAVGCHWLTPEQYPSMVGSPFFGGTFWWANAKYLLQLPRLPEPSWQNRFEAESWIGRRRPYPHINDYYPGWP